LHGLLAALLVLWLGEAVGPLAAAEVAPTRAFSIPAMEAAQVSGSGFSRHP
jgi:hypothetical protein